MREAHQAVLPTPRPGWWPPSFRPRSTTLGRASHMNRWWPRWTLTLPPCPRRRDRGHAPPHSWREGSV